jgi:hypothetical protein
MTPGVATVWWSYTDPSNSPQSAFNLRFLDLHTLTFSVSGTADGYDGTYAFSHISRKTVQVGATDNYVQGLVIANYVSGSNYVSFDGYSWTFGGYVGDGPTPEDVPSWKRYGTPVSLTVTNINISDATTGWVTSSLKTYAYSSPLPKGFCGVSLQVKNSLGSPLESGFSGCNNIAREVLPWTRKTLQASYFAPPLAGDTHFTNTEWISVWPLLLKDYDDFPIDSWEREVVGEGFLEKIGEEWVISPHSGYGVFANVSSDSTGWPNPYILSDYAATTTNMLDQFNTANGFTYRIDAPPSVPVAMIKMRGDNPYFLEQATIYSNYGFLQSLTNSDSVGCGGARGGYDLSGNIYFVSDSYTHLSMPKPGTFSIIPRRNPLIASGVSVSVTLANHVSMTSQQIAAATAPGYSDEYTMIPGKIWARMRFSSDGRGGSLVEYPMEAELQETGGSQTTLTFHVPPEVIGSNEWIEEIAIYWRKPFAYFKKVPFPTSVSEITTGAYRVIPVGYTTIHSINIGHET